MKYLLILIISLLYITSISADEYIRELDDLFTVKPYLGANFCTLYLVSDHSNNDDENVKSIEYNPNTSPKLGLSLSYKVFGGSFAIKFHDYLQDEKLAGKSDYLDFQINYYGKMFGIDAYLQNYKGFYISNPEEINSNWCKGDKYPIYDELRILNIFLNWYYVFSGENYSLKAAFDQTAIQLKSAGSFLATASINWTKITNDGVILPSEIADSYGELSNIKGGRFTTLSLGGGYGYTYVHWDNFYLTFAGLISCGFQFQRFYFEDKTSNKLGLSPKPNVRFAYGYNTIKYFTGLTFVMDTNLIYYDSKNSIIINSINLQVFLGMRFGK